MGLKDAKDIEAKFNLDIAVENSLNYVGNIVQGSYLDGRVYISRHGLLDSAGLSFTINYKLQEQFIKKLIEEIKSKGYEVKLNPRPEKVSYSEIRISWFTETENKKEQENSIRLDFFKKY